jgi:dihydrodipicolinate synthase/N-acetylneuraminate lyase
VVGEFAIHAALATPFGDDGSVDLDALRAHLEFLVEEGLDGVVVAGTTGEGPLLEEAEVEALNAAAVDAAAGRLEVIAHVGRASTAATVRLARAATRAGADALIAITPYYYAVDGDGLLRHYRALLDAAAGAIPVLAYTFPDRTGNELPAEVLDTLASDGLAGLKDSTKSPERHREYLDVARRHEGLRVYVGSERLTLESLRGGGAGAISALANARAGVLQRLRREQTEEALADVEGARRELPEIPQIKAAVRELLAARGVRYPAAPRAPLAG